MKETMEFSPPFTQVIDIFENIIKVMVTSVTKMSRVETLLFQPVDAIEQNPLATVMLYEEVVDDAKMRMHTLVTSNSHGPKR